MWLMAGLIPFIVYILTLAPSVTFGDSGELITAAYSLGISHPPGSPLWTIIAKIFTFLPFNSVAWRVNLVSSVFAALSSFVIYKVLSVCPRESGVKSFSVSPSFVVLISVFTFSFSRSLWGLSVVAEVYTLNIFLFALSMLSFISWQETQNKWYLWITWLTVGLSLSNHYINVLMLPFWGLGMIWFHPRVFGRSKELLVAVVCFFIGLSVYFYVPWRAQANPAINWGNPRTLTGFINYLERKPLATNAIARDVDVGVRVPLAVLPTIAQLPDRLVQSVSYIVRVWSGEFVWPAIAVGAVGLIWFLVSRNQRKLGVWLFGGLLLSNWGYAFLTNARVLLPEMSYQEFLFGFLIWVIFVQQGILRLYFWVERKHPGFTWAVLFFALTIPAYQLVKFFPVNNWSWHQIAVDHGKNILSSLPANSVLLISHNMWVFPVLYLTAVEKKRPDLVIIDRQGNQINGGYAPFSDLVTNISWRNVDQIVARFPGRPIFMSGDKDLEDSFPGLPVEGILYRISSDSGRLVDFATSYQNILDISGAPWEDSDTQYILSYYHLRLGDEFIAKNQRAKAFAEYDRAQSLGQYSPVALTNLAVINAQENEIDQAINLSEQALILQPDRLVALRNLGRLYVVKNDLDQAVRVLSRAVQIDPSHSLTQLQLVSVYEQLAKSLLKKGECQMAADKYVLPLAKSPAVHVFYNNLGVCWARKNDMVKAKNYWQQALSSKPDYQEARDNLNQMGAVDR